MYIIKTVLVVLLGLSIPVSTAATNMLCAFALCLFILEGRFAYKLDYILHHPIAQASLAVFSLLLLGTLYTSATPAEAWAMVNKYRELAYIPLFLGLFHSTQHQRLGLYAFFTSMLITLALSYGLVFFDFSTISAIKGNASNAFVFKNHITQGVLFALTAYFICLYGLKKSPFPLLYGFIIIALVYNVLFLSEGRTGYLLLLCLACLACYQFYQWRGIVISFLLLCIAAPLAYLSSDTLRQRIDNLKKMAEPSESKVKLSSQYRYDFYKNTLELIQQSPVWIGKGTGSFAQEYAKIAEQKNQINTTNPHSDYLMITAQFGYLGLLVFSFFLLQLWRYSYHLEADFRGLAQGLVVTMIIGGFVNTFWLDNTEGHLFAFLIALLYANSDKYSFDSFQEPSRL